MLTLRAGSKRLIREINQAIVLDAVRAHGMLSRTEAAQRTGLSLPTVSGITAELLDAGLLYERATGTSTGGRRPVLLSVNARAGYVAGAKVTDRAVIAVLTDLDATVVARHTSALGSRAPGRVAATLAGAVEALAPAARGGPLLGAGAGLAGVIDRDTGVVHHSTHLDWHDVPFGPLLEERLNVPVAVDNDVNALVATEQWFGAGRGVADFLVISLGRGVGLGMVLDGRLYRGSTGGAGEFGHVKVSPGPGAPRCACGSRGCLEASVGDAAIARQASAGAGRALDADEAAGLARTGDPLARGVFEDAGRLLGTAAANLVNVLDPGLIILSGEGTRASDLLLGPFRRALAEHCFDGLGEGTRVVVEPWDDEAWARGAASLLLGELFQPALHQGEGQRPSLPVRTAS